MSQSTAQLHVHIITQTLTEACSFRVEVRLPLSYGVVMSRVSDDDVRTFRTLCWVIKLLVTGLANQIWDIMGPGGYMDLILRLLLCNMCDV